MIYKLLKTNYFILLILLPGYIFGQQYYRISAEFSIKSKNPDSTFQLYMGKVYFDKVYKKIVYDLSFPENESWVIKDTLLYKFIEDQFVEKKAAYGLVETSIFNLTLNGNLTNYGLENSSYTLNSVEHDDGLLISTWIPPEQFSKSFGKILVANKNRELEGIIVYNSSEEVLSKQFFKNYMNVDGIDFPAEVIQFMYPGGIETYQVTTFKNIVIDESEKEDTYNYPVPVF
ncbi:MAG: hypothetical protein K8S16_03710 [Bacteroidales bacterium]|nr:hypothetical protein [Bacteroidales bacterium]